MTNQEKYNGENVPIRNINWRCLGFHMRISMIIGLWMIPINERSDINRAIGRYVPNVRR